MRTACPYAMSKLYMETIAHIMLGMIYNVYESVYRKNVNKILKDDVNYINVDHSRDFIH